MNKTKLITCVSLILMTTSLWANPTTSPLNNNQNQADENGLISPYGQNPNIFHVFAYKTQEGIKNTATRIGSATERGWNKLKPKAKAAEEGIEHTAQAAGQKITEVKNGVFGDPKDGPAPIIQQPLEQNTRVNP
ncbi:hypothetical protein B9T31_16145 [Acinetobacter sp. ANC 4558]|uniref:hypothetical protein n=1 Tax=Acinetobacter sp. ANC 4558 TaxID=1977876 RepID=UPI000A32C3BF|nr:hypothetical protein [Acinetobacter sp. ANC 4558]OTG80416.1 hypothetical protein B9T31_16145 [Acinetobacter sp. ANC 4558]